MKEKKRAKETIYSLHAFDNFFCLTFWAMVKILGFMNDLTGVIIFCK